MEEVPSSSASSVAPSAATTPAAAKTAASIQEINDETEPGWIFGVMGGSVATVITGTDDLGCWTVCMVFGHQCVPARHSETQNSSRIVGTEGRVECKVKFDVADVVYPVVSLGKMIEWFHVQL